MKFFLVYGECVCGWRCACGEGAQWPDCPACGRKVMPPRPDSPLERMGLVAELLPEQEAVREADASLAPDGEALHLRRPSAARVYSAEALRHEARAREVRFDNDEAV